MPNRHLRYSCLFCENPLMSTIGLKAFGNGLSLVGALVFLVLFLIGQDRSLINPLGDLWLNAYLEPHSIQFKRLIEQVDNGQTEQAINQLQSEWKDIQKRDRIYNFKSRLLFALAKELLRQRRYSELLHWSSEWVRLDERNIDAIAFWYEAIRNFPGREKEGLEGLIKSQRDFPESTLLSGFLIHAYRETGNTGAAESLIRSRTDLFFRQAGEEIIDGWELELRWRAEHTTLVQNLIEHYDNNRWPEIWKSLKEIWKFYFVWKENKELYEKKQIREFSIQPDADGINTIVMSVDPVITTTIRIDPPSDSMLIISGIKLRINGQPMELTERMIEYANMYERDGYIWQTGMNKPRFYLKVAGLLGNIARTKAPIELEFKASLSDEFGDPRLVTNKKIDDHVNSAE